MRYGVVNYELGTNVVDVYVNYLRKKLDNQDNSKLIHTVIGMGYVLKDHSRCLTELLQNQTKTMILLMLVFTSIIILFNGLVYFSIVNFSHQRFYELLKIRTTTYYTDRKV